MTTIRTKSYMNIDEFYEQNILKQSESQEKLNSFKRYNNYPWAASKFQIDHDFSKKSVSSSKNLLMKKLRQQEVDRQSKINQKLFTGQSCAIKNYERTKLPLIKRH